MPVNEALFNLTITEIMYKPALYSFIELKNIGDVALNLSGAALVNGIYIVFPSSLILDSKQFLVLAANASQFQLKYQKSPSLQYNVTSSSYQSSPSSFHSVVELCEFYYLMIEVLMS